jgi:hypothetical protein
MEHDTTEESYTLMMSHMEHMFDKPRGQRIVLDEEIPLDLESLEQLPVNFSGVLARAFDPWPANRSIPCFDPQEHPGGKHWTHKRVQKKPAAQGLFFLKLLKTASSSSAGLHLRIARNLAQRTHTDYEICRSRFLHGWAGPRMYKYGQRNRTESFLWTMLREPTARYASEFFHFEVSRANVAPSDDNFIHFLQKGKHADHHYLSWLSTAGYKFGRSDPVQSSNSILSDYDFIGVTERMDESAVCLMMLLRLKVADILHLSSKNSGGYDDGAFKNQCVYITPTIISEGIRDYFASDEWQRYVQPERALYEAANRSLDLTIEKLGRDVFQANLARYRHAQQWVKKRCLSKTAFPCTDTGKRIKDNATDCLSSDLGCGFACIDEVSTELGLWQ